MKKNRIAGLLILLLGGINLNAQEATFSARQAEIHYQMSGQGTQFSASTPPLRQIAGAPPAFYSYFWEFGDGQFSFEERPLHIYPHTGEFEARLFLTNNYDDGKPPPARPKKLYVKKSLLAGTDVIPVKPAVVEAGRSLRIQTNHDPSPEEEVVCVFSYKNQERVAIDGRLYLFYNERKFKQTHFSLKDSRTYHGERLLRKEEYYSFQAEHTFPDQELWASAEAEIIATAVPQPITAQVAESIEPEKALGEAREAYRESVAWHFNDLRPSEERHIFTSLMATDEMLADTNAIISIQAIFVPEGGQDIEIFTLEMPIVNSHDPNHISVSDTRVNFRRAKNKDLTYKVRFQNIGRGPASEVRIETHIPKGLSIQDLELLEYYPYCPICPDTQVSYSCLDTLTEEGKITFFFHNIYLPGIRQKGIQSRDSTKGFVKFRLQPQKKLKRIALNSRADIFFDKNAPIRTNSAITQFTGYAPGFKAGVDLRTSDFGVHSYFVGLTLSPVRAAKWYYQAEIMLGFGSNKDQGMNCFETEVLSSDNQAAFFFVLQEANLTERTIFLDVVPLQFRKNLLDLLSVGAGTQISLILNQKRETELRTHPEFFEDEECQFPAFPITPPPIPELRTENLPKKGTINLFVDVNAGLVKNGPVGGLRYLYSLSSNFSDRLQLYMNWKF